MKTKVYQVIREAFDKDGYLMPKEQRTTKVLCIGTVVIPDRKNGEDHLEESIWDLFNWTCWGWGDRVKAYDKGIRKGIRSRGIRMFPNRNSEGYCNSDIFFQMWGTWYVAKSSGWDTSAKTYEEAKNICINNQRY